MTEYDTTSLEVSGFRKDLLLGNSMAVLAPVGNEASAHFPFVACDALFSEPACLCPYVYTPVTEDSATSGYYGSAFDNTPAAVGLLPHGTPEGRVAGQSLDNHISRKTLTRDLKESS